MEPFGPRLTADRKSGVRGATSHDTKLSVSEAAIRTSRQMKYCRCVKNQPTFLDKVNFRLMDATIAFHSVVSLATGPQPLPQRVLQIMRPTASSSNLQYLRVSLKPYSSCLPLLSRLPVTSTPPSISLNNVFQKTVPTRDVTNPISLHSLYCI